MEQLQITLIVIFMTVSLLIFIYPVIEWKLHQIRVHIAPEFEYSNIKNELSGKFKYFDALSPKGKEIFINRVSHILHEKNIRGVDGFRAEFQHKVFIAACMAQVTFGLRNYILRKIKLIRIFPEAFYSEMHNTYFRGSTSKMGTLSFSWKHFEEGYKIEDDNINLGIHELSHALKVNLVYGSDFDQAFANYYDEWLKGINEHFIQSKSSINKYFRAYGYTNMDEFFAVSMECFFEKPAELKRVHPEIYEHLSLLLNQDPLNINNDYKLCEFSNPNFFKSTQLHPKLFSLFPRHRYSSWHWSYAVILLGLFSFPFYAFGFIATSLIPTQKVFIFILTGLAIGLCFIKPLYLKKLMDLRFYVFFCIVGSGLNFCTLLFILNFAYASIFGNRIEYPFNKNKFDQSELWVLNDRLRDEVVKVEVNNANSENKLDMEFKTGFFNSKVFCGIKKHEAISNE